MSGQQHQDAGYDTGTIYSADVAAHNLKKVIQLSRKISNATYKMIKVTDDHYCSHGALSSRLHSVGARRIAIGSAPVRAAS